MNKTVLLWDYSLDRFFFEDVVDGISVQLFFWSSTFIEHEWKVMALTTKNRPQDNVISFIKLKESSFGFIMEWVNVFNVIRKFHPRLIIVRGADRKTFPIAILSKWFNIKFVFFAASDVNFVPGKEQIGGNKLNRKLYQKSLCRIPYFVTQNKFQQSNLLNVYGKTCLMLPNIWRVKTCTESSEKTIDVIWVANFRRLKRAEWMVNAARKNPNLRFALIGRQSAEKEYYEQIERDCSELGNIEFYGPLSFEKTNALVSQSNLLACTSEFEGFPNTFLQAWAYTIPVVSTVDPSNLIANNNLGLIVKDEDEFNSAICRLLEEFDDYKEKCQCINNYFQTNHSANRNFEKLMNYIQE